MGCAASSPANSGEVQVGTGALTWARGTPPGHGGEEAPLPFGGRCSDVLPHTGLQAPIVDACRTRDVAALERELMAGAPPDLADTVSCHGWRQAPRSKHQHQSRPAQPLPCMDAHVHAPCLQQDGWTSMHWAASNSDLQSLALLIKFGANPSKADRVGMTPLHWAARVDFHEGILLLLKAGAKVNGKSKEGLTALHCAARFSHLESIRVLVKQPGVDVNAPDKDSWTPLNVAVENNLTAAISLLLDNGADMSLLDKVRLPASARADG
jgi:hypothetical protein